MTEENRRANVAHELERARECLQAAETLANVGLGADSVSRAYYAAFHLTRALLYAKGVEPKSHAGALHLLNVEFVRPGALPTTVNRLIAGLQRTRELADYDAAARFSSADAHACLAEARSFERLVIDLLRGSGFAT